MLTVYTNIYSACAVSQYITKSCMVDIYGNRLTVDMYGDIAGNSGDVIRGLTAVQPGCCSISMLCTVHNPIILCLVRQWAAILQTSH